MDYLKRNNLVNVDKYDDSDYSDLDSFLSQSKGIFNSSERLYISTDPIVSDEFDVRDTVYTAGEIDNGTETITSKATLTDTNKTVYLVMTFDD